MSDEDDDNLEVALVHPFQARKQYLCPGCNQDIAVGVAHFVVVPLDVPEQRRHWHKACWHQRARRRPGSPRPHSR
ncbi:MAG TPA: hypothetical protein VHD87_11730 [Acidimicrobiales bacterium]|nr:hypothetical protein [Acidimicrobiales bacterium]